MSSSEENTPMACEEAGTTSSSSNTSSSTKNEDTFKKPQFAVPEKMPNSVSKRSEEAFEKQQEKQQQQQQQQQQQPLKYVEPAWSAIPPSDRNYHLEVIKGGIEIEPVDLSQRPYFVVGRMTDCHLPLQHPSLSRYHAVLQYCDASGAPGLRDGWYVFDLGSSNGTVVNKKRLAPLNYRPLEIGHVIKFGMSTRIFILQGKQQQEGDSSNIQADEKPKFRIPEGLLLKKPKQHRRAPPLPTKSTDGDGGCMWGIAMDDEAVYESANADPNFDSDSSSSGDNSGDESSSKKRHKKPLDLSDPKKTLRVFFEREDLGPPDYQIENAGKSRHRAWLDIPAEAGTGKAIRVEGEGGSKKEAVADCAREACITLDKLDILRPRNKVTQRKETNRDWAANDYYDSDEDNFLDRTGDIERKRQQRMIRAKNEAKGKMSNETVHTAQSLSSDLERFGKEIESITSQLAEEEEKRAKIMASRKTSKTSELDALDAYMSGLRQGGMDATTRVRLKHRLLELQKEKARCERMLVIAKGPELPASLRTNAWTTANVGDADSKKPTSTPESDNGSQPSGLANVGKMPRPAFPSKFPSNLPPLKPSSAFEVEKDDDDEMGIGKPKMKKLEHFLKEGEEVELKQPAGDEKAEQDEEKEEDDGAEKKVYSVFLPPELRESLETHADEVDDIWDVERAEKLANIALATTTTDSTE